MTSKRAALAALTAVLLVVGLVVGAVEAATTRTSTTTSAHNACATGKTVSKHGSAQRASAACRLRRPTSTATSTVTATVTATVTQMVTAWATATVTVTSSSSPTAGTTTAQAPTQSPPPTATSTTTTSSPPTSGTWPNAGNTGVPAGTALTSYTGSCTISSAVVISAKTINCPNGLLVQAANVVIQKSKIYGPVIVDTDVNRTWSLSLTDSEVDSGPGDWASISSGNVDLLRVNIHGGHNGLECQEHASWCSIKDSWIHDQYRPATGDVHLGGLLGLGSVMSCRNSLCMEIVHNTIVCDAPENSSGGGCTGDINLLPHFGPLSGALVKDNLLGANSGAAYCTYGGSGMEYPADHIVYSGNVFQRGTNAQCAGYGPVTNFDSSAAGNAWSGNVWDTGEVLRPAM